MTKSYPDITKRISSGMKTLRADITDTMQGFSALAQAATKDGALDKKTKEFIAQTIRVIHFGEPTSNVVFVMDGLYAVSYVFIS